MELAIEGLTCAYGSRTVLNGLDLRVADGEFLAVVGPNGSGKSTLVRAISRGIRSATGRVLLDGRPVGRLSAREWARQVAVVAQETAVGFDFTVEELVMLGRLPYLSRLRGETERDRAVVRRALEATGTAGLAGRLITQLSGGERQRVMVARALAQEPRLLILDEPTAHLDIAHQVEILDLCRRLNRQEGLTVLAVLHDLNLAGQYADRILLIKEGRAYAFGPPAEVLTEANLLGVYGSRVKVVRHPVDGTPHVILLAGQSQGEAARPWDAAGFAGCDD